MQDLGNTQFFNVAIEPENGVKIVLSTVYEALTEKGYNPITTHNHQLQKSPFPLPARQNKKIPQAKHLWDTHTFI